MQWDQVRELLALQDRLDTPMGGAQPGWSPAVDLYEAPDCYVIAMELAGLSKDDVRIEAQGDRLTLSGARPAPSVTPERYHQMERGHGAFARTFAFAHPIDVERLTADFHQGVLSVTVPKTRGHGPRRITVG